MGVKRPIRHRPTVQIQTVPSVFRSEAFQANETLLEQQQQQQHGGGAEPAAEQEAMSCYSCWKEGYYTIVPEGNPWLDCWDVLVIIALLLTAIILPMDVAVMTDNRPTVMAVLEGLIDWVFIIDIFLTFFVAYGVTSVSNRDMFERAPLKIARHYMTVPFSDNLTAGWFWPDVITVLPWDRLSSAKDFRLIRVMRLLRLFRLIRVVKLFKRFHTHFGFPIAVLDVLRCIGVTLVICHWFACAWAHMAVTADDGDDWLSVWLAQYRDGQSRRDTAPLEIYSLSFYWAFATLTSTGYGDVAPENQREVALTSILMLILSMLWAWVLAHLVNVITNMDVFATESRQLMDDLNLLMAHRGLCPYLRQRLRKHLYESFHVHRQRHQQRTVKWLSAGLQGEIAVVSGVDKACHCVWYLRNLDETVLIAIAQRFVADMFSPNEFIKEKHCLLVIRSGSCIRRAKLLTRDHVIGEDMILASEYLVDTVCPKTLTFLEVLRLTRHDLVNVCESHPAFDKSLRRAQVKLALWRAIILEAHTRKRGMNARRTSRVSRLSVATSTMSARLRRPQPLFSQTVGTNRGFRGISLQESLTEVVEQLETLRRRVDDGTTICDRQFEELTDRMDSMLGRMGAAKKSKSRSSFGLPFCGRPIP